MSEPRELHASKIKRFTPAVKYVIIVNVIAFGISYLTYYFWGYDIFRQFALYYPGSENFRWYQLITHIFLHGGWLHILINMFVLWMFGTVLESVWRAPKFLSYYFITGFGAAGLHLFVTMFSVNSLEEATISYQESPTYDSFVAYYQNEVENVPPEVSEEFTALSEKWEKNPDNPAMREESAELVGEYYEYYRNIPTVGASGAVYGLLMAFGLMFPNVLVYLWLLIPIKAKYFVIILGVFELTLGITKTGGNIANFAHLGGMLFGFILLKIWREKRVKIIRRREYPEYGNELDEEYFR